MHNTGNPFLRSERSSSLRIPILNLVMMEIVSFDKPLICIDLFSSHYHLFSLLFYTIKSLIFLKVHISSMLIMVGMWMILK